MTYQILLAEDDAQIREVIEYYFSGREGGALRVTAAQDGREGLCLWKGGSYDLVMLDILMPGMDGFALCREIRRDSDVPLLFLTAMHRKKQDYYTDAILQNAQYMDNIISDVLALSVLEETPSIAAQSTDIMQLVQEAFAQYAPELAERHISLAIGGNCTVLADRRMMAQAAANLVSNAVRCTPCRGAITVSGSEGLLTISNDCTEITDAADLAEPFVKGDAARSGRRGSGLGLSIVRQILRLHHAALVLDVRDGKFIAEMRFSD